MRIWNKFFKQKTFQFGFETWERSVLFFFLFLFFICQIAHNWHYSASIMLGAFQNAPVYVVCFCPSGKELQKQIESLTKPFTAFMGQIVPLDLRHNPSWNVKFGYMWFFQVKFLFRNSCTLRHFSSNLQGFYCLLTDSLSSIDMHFIMYEDPLELFIRMLGRFTYFFFLQRLGKRIW